jgi:hypothetical protein
LAGNEKQCKTEFRSPRWDITHRILSFAAVVQIGGHPDSLPIGTMEHSN